MRQRGEWMKPVDDLILELLSEEGQYPPKIIAEKIDKHPKYVGERCRTLRDYGLTRNLGRGLYQITDQGEEYLEGELNADNLASDSNN
ncbi:MAG: hypothetical protein ABEI86_13450 [Halobacteriaceae archaeon]